MLNLFTTWLSLGRLQKQVERLADLEDAYHADLARNDAHTRQLLDLLDDIAAAWDQPARLQALEDELLELDAAAWHDYQLAKAG